MSQTDSALLVFAKLALADGKIDCSEQDFLTELMSDSVTFSSVDELLTEARSKSLEDMVITLEKYEDKFFVAMRAYLMAHIDLHFDVREEVMFNKLVDLLGISEGDQELIQQVEKNLRSETPDPPHERIQGLYEASSFFQEGQG